MEKKTQTNMKIILHFQGLKANVLQRFEENARQALQEQNQDSSDRHRSGSYSEAALRRYTTGLFIRQNSYLK